MPGIAQRINNNTSSDNNDTNTCYRNPSTGNGTPPLYSLNGSSISSNGFWSQHRGDLSYNQLQKVYILISVCRNELLIRLGLLNSRNEELLLLCLIGCSWSTLDLSWLILWS